MSLPTPYYDEDGITIYHGDCRELLSSLEFDKIIGDPPYANDTPYESWNDTQEALASIVDAVSPFLLRGGAITPGVANVHKWPAPRWIMAWIESAGVGSGPWGFSCWQPILTYGADPFLAQGLGRRPDIYQGRGRGASHPDHPVAKPLGVMRWIVDRVCLPDDVICDPFMGSGTTLVAAREQGRKAIGIEIEESYCEIAVQRLAQGVLAI